MYIIYHLPKISVTKLGFKPLRFICMNLSSNSEMMKQLCDTVLYHCSVLEINLFLLMKRAESFSGLPKETAKT